VYAAINHTVAELNASSACWCAVALQAANAIISDGSSEEREMRLAVGFDLSRDAIPVQDLRGYRLRTR
jgi:hypothetical protein